ncbi:MAG: protein kinase [Myxococcales bacterium]|nr:protein kinase [Myxococcales bacterium]
MLGRLLGAGGTAAVFEGIDADLDRRVAIKILRAQTPRQRLVREAQALARLRHPNVVAFYEIGEDQAGFLYIVMELVQGQTLGQLLRSAPPLATIIDLFVGAGRGLEAAHRAGLAHRDFKPANVLVSDEQVVRVVDFGLAKDSAVVPTTAPIGALADRFATQTGALLGTPYYMAPEQHAGQPGDAKGDQFSFALSLWLALGGVHPLQEDSGHSVAPSWNRVLKSSELSAPRWLQRVLIRALQLDPDKRWPDMGALIDRIERSPLRRFLRRALMALVVLVIVGVVALLVRSLLESHEREEQVRAAEREALARAQASASAARDRGLVLAARLSRADPTVALLTLQEVQHPESTPGWFSVAFDLLNKPVSSAVLRGHEDRVLNASFSPNGRWLATASADGTARVWRRDGRGDPLVLRGHTDRVHFANFSPDSRWLVTSSRDRRALVWDLEHPETPVELAGHDSILWWAGFSPDGRWIATASRDQTARLWSTSEVLSSASGPVEPPAILSGHDDQIWWGEFNPESTHLVTASKDGTARVWSLAEPDSPPLVLSHDKSKANVLRAHFSPDGTKIVTAGMDETIRVWSLPEQSDLALTTRGFPAHDATFSDDGALLLASWAIHASPKIWDATSGELVAELDGAKGFSEHGAFLSGTQSVVVADSGCVWHWRDPSDTSPAALCGLGSSAAALVTTDDGMAVAAATTAGEIRVWEKGSWEATTLVHRGDSGLTISNDDSFVVASDRQLSELSVHSAVTSHRLARIQKQGDSQFRYVALHPDGKRALITTTTGIILWDIWSERAVWRHGLQNESQANAFFAGHGHVLVCELTRKRASLLNAQTGESVKWTVSATAGGAASVQSSSFATIHSDGLLHLWDIGRDGATSVPRILARLETSGMGVSIEPGPTLVAIGGSQVVALSLPDGRQLFQHRMKGSMIAQALVSPTGRLLVVRSNTQVEVWDLQRRALVDSWRADPGNAATASHGLSLSKSEKFLAIAEAETVSVRDLTLGAWIGSIDAVQSPLKAHFVGSEDDLWILGRGSGIHRFRTQSLLVDGPAEFEQYSRQRTSACLSPQQREVLGEAPMEAALGALSCELANGRRPSLTFW